MVKLLVLLVGFTCWQVLVSLILWGDYAKISVTSSSKAVPCDCFFLVCFVLLKRFWFMSPSSCTLILYFSINFRRGDEPPSIALG